MHIICVSFILYLMVFLPKTLSEEGEFRPRVVNGEIAKLGEVPYQVSIKKRGFLSKWSNTCGGAIIGPEKVLSAAHCFAHNKKKRSLFKNGAKRRSEWSSLQIVAGNLMNTLTKPDTETIETGQWRSIKNVTWPRQYSFPRHDIAIVFIHGNWTFNDNVKMINHAKVNKDYGGTTCQISGYGKTGKSSGASEVLLKATVKVKSNAQCEKEMKRSRAKGRRLICTDDSFADTHKGDSGGPLVCYNTGDPEEIPGLGVVVGLVSGKQFEKSFLGLGKGINTSFFLRVSTYYNWIKKNEAKFRFNSNLVLICVCTMFLYVCS